jgi:Mn2+/Fe2+ NRAMP family transporter
LFGPVVYAGYLDEAVGHEYFRGHRVRLRTILQTLPWGRLVVADLILVVGTAIGLALFVVPGLIWLTLLTLVGPVLVQERHGLSDGFRRTFGLARDAWPMILVLVVALLAVENVVHELVHRQFHHSSIWLQVGTSWLVSAFIGGLVGLVEVALATELMARSPLGQHAAH